MYGSIFGGQYVYYYDFPSHVESEYSPQLLTAYPVITSENDDYTIESNRFSEYLKNIKEQCDDKIVWMISAVPDLLDSLEDVIPLRHICDYFNASDYWKKNGDWPEHVDENKLRAFNIEVLKVWLFQKTTHDFYAQNNDTPPSLNEYKMQLVINLEQFKQELLALNALNLMRSNPDQSVVKLWESLSPDGSLDKFNVFNSSAIIQMIKEQNLFPEDMRLNINPRSFEYWQQIHNTLNDELIKIINNSILNNLEKKCVQYCSDIPFEQLCKTYWPGAQRFNDNDPPLYSVSEINDFMEKILSHAGEQCNIMIEEKKSEWKGSPAGFDVAMERTRAILKSKHANNEEFIQTLTEQLEHIAAEDHVIESLSLINSNPLKLVTQVLDEEHVYDIAALAPVIVRDIQHVIEHMVDKPVLVDYSKNVQALDQFVLSVRSACNRAALIDLYERLEKSTNKEIAEKMIGDLDVIGTDICASERMMTESDKLRIIAYAEGKMLKEEYLGEMSKLRVKFERGEITVQEEVVIKMFPKLKQALTRLPKEYLEDFSLVLKRAFVHQQLTHPEKFLQNPHEAAVFSAFNLDPSKIKVNQELVKQKIKHVIQNVVLNGQAENEIPTLKELQYHIELMAMKEKITAAGGEPSLALLIHTVTKARQELISILTHLIDQEYEHCKSDLNDTNEHISQHIECSLKISKNRLLRSLCRFIDQKIKTNKDNLALVGNQQDKVTEIITPLNDQFSDKIQKRLLGDVKKDIDFFNQWGDPIQYENIQGFIGGNGEILGNGACQANTYRIITREMTSVDRKQILTHSQWENEVKISLQDRYNQALYQVDRGEGCNNGLSKSVLKRLNLKKIQGLNEDSNFADEPAFSSDSLYQIFSQAVRQQHKSKLKNCGIVKISFGHHCNKRDGTETIDEQSWGHAVYFRYDPKRKIAYFYDPNHGRSINFYTWKKLQKDTDFQKMNHYDRDEAVLNYMLLCFSQMIHNDFNDINTVKCYEMEMDFSFKGKLFSAGNTILGGINSFFKNEKEKEPEYENLRDKPGIS